MTGGSRRGVTRGYVGGLITAALIAAVTLVVAVWGLTGLALGIEPIVSDVPRWAAPLILLVLVALLAVALWRQALELLRGRRAPAWGSIVSVSVGAYLLWSLGGILAGMSIQETWTSPFGIALVPIWCATCLLFWAVLARRVYTDRPVPKWPWERESEDE